MSSTVSSCSVIIINLFFLKSCSPESMFLDHALSSDTHHLTDELAITYRLDICGLYKVRGRVLVVANSDPSH